MTHKEIGKMVVGFIIDTKLVRSVVLEDISIWHHSSYEKVGTFVKDKIIYDLTIENEQLKKDLLTTKQHIKNLKVFAKDLWDCIMNIGKEKGDNNETV